MNIRELLAYYEQPVLQPLLLEVGTLLLKVIYGCITEADIDKAKNLVYNADIEADWLVILAEGNPAYLDDVVEQVNYDICLSEESHLLLPSPAIVEEIKLANELNQAFWDGIFGVEDVDPNDDMPIYDAKDLDQEDIDYLWSEFGVFFDDEGEIQW